MLVPVQCTKLCRQHSSLTTLILQEVSMPVQCTKLCGQHSSFAILNLQGAVQLRAKALSSSDAHIKNSEDIK